MDTFDYAFNSVETLKEKFSSARIPFTVVYKFVRKYWERKGHKTKRNKKIMRHRTCRQGVRSVYFDETSCKGQAKKGKRPRHRICRRN